MNIGDFGKLPWVLPELVSKPSGETLDQDCRLQGHHNHWTDHHMLGCWYIQVLVFRNNQGFKLCRLDFVQQFVVTSYSMRMMGLRTGSRNQGIGLV